MRIDVISLARLDGLPDEFNGASAVALLVLDEAEQVQRIGVRGSACKICWYSVLAVAKRPLCCCPMAICSVAGIKARAARALAACAASLAWQQCLYFLPLPQGQGALRSGFCH